jgi:hypothetical protein
MLTDRKQTKQLKKQLTSSERLNLKQMLDNQIAMKERMKKNSFNDQFKNGTLLERRHQRNKQGLISIKLKKSKSKMEIK